MYRYKKTYNIAFQLGLFVGEYIIHEFLPTLSTDSLTSWKVIQVSEEDTLENERLHDIWSKKALFNHDGIEKSKKEWNAFYLHNKYLSDKYMPPVLKCYVPEIDVKEENILDFKLGIQSSLWDCDMCGYNCSPEDIEIDTTQSRHTIIQFPLDRTIRLQPE